ncbi:Methyltransferase domain-containing protein [Pedobacter steynii]|uniref:Methyltransferase domain-containing protein n=1 Tax=Pedobacter steynii TaxID=430522 RepID=A0A1H0FNZ0_9SPHI|nr:class I SAM-dependent methyltransferase [Pedobacter steynii]NQX42046.1 class I SAM-dependent methyltransferase [Pedobacter steynii]SDN96396.1 Methyltransferase domain-containing protein [Pedobacter steynii]
MEKDVRKNVFEVYNQVADWFSENRDQGLMEKKYLDEVIAHLNDDSCILDLGCGTGIPILGYFLSRKLNITGLDASSKILSIAKKNFPSTPFIQADMRELSLNKKFDAIIAWHSFFHLPAEDQPAMFGIFEKHLNPGGILLFTSGTIHGEAWGQIGGEKLFHGSLSTEEYQRSLTAHHFSLLKHQVNDPQCGNANIWMAKYTPV